MNEKGMSIVEVLIVIALLSIVSLGFVRWMATSQEAALFAGERARAVLLAEEGLEATRNMRDGDYNNVTLGAHGLAVSGGVWTFAGTSDTVDGFTRVVTASPVDASRKQIESEVSWQETTYHAAQVALTTYLTNWQAASGRLIPITPDATLDLTGPADGTEVAMYTSGLNTYVILGRVSSAEPELYVIDVTDPAVPTVVGSLEIGADVNDIAVVGTNAYLATTDNSAELRVVSLVTPSTPTSIGTLNLAGNTNAQTVVAEGTNLYLGRAADSTRPEIHSISIAVPAAPTSLSTIEVGDSVWKMALGNNDDYVLAATGSNSAEFVVVDVTVPALIVQVGSLNLSGNADGTAVAAFSTYAVLGRDDGFFYTVDVTTPSAPATLGSMDVGVKINDLAMGVDDDYVFAGNGSVGTEVAVVDITTLSTPTSYYAVDLFGNEAMGLIWDEGLNRVFGAARGNTTEFFVLIP
ncbi:MAG: prepilin-type N-terminal cleavage/methylation domain-containing protein [Patescibacteria group bacterium]